MDSYQSGRFNNGFPLLTSCRVFVLADPAVFSAPLEAAVRTHLEESSFFTDTMEKNVVLHVLQTGMGTSCQSSTLAQALKVELVSMFWRQ